MHRFSLRNIRQLSTSIASKTLHYREAIVSDALQIMSCNRRNLPENYSFEFFENHLELWPDLSLVAENDNEIIGYVLARIESNSTHQHREMLHQSSTTCAAHIMSIAIDSAYRRRGTALLMMEAIHQKAFQNNKVGYLHLFCRVSTSFLSLNSYSYIYIFIPRHM
jgi:ribosomal protein S18 acetylase RimI-like enzyme